MALPPTAFPRTALSPTAEIYPEFNQITFKLDSPLFTLTHSPFDCEFTALRNGKPDTSFADTVQVSGITSITSNGERPIEGLVFSSGKASLSQVYWQNKTESRIDLAYQSQTTRLAVHTIPSWFSILPPLIAIVTAILFRQVLLSLFAGIWLGAFFINGYNPLTGLLRVLDHYLIQALASPDHVAVMLFTLTLGGMVGIISRSGGTAGMVESLSKRALSQRSGQVVTWFMGILIFFDDYANTLIVGNTMRPITDKLRISREKLSFIVDATAAPVVCIAVFSTWIGFELGLIADAFDNIGLDKNVYWTYLQSIPYSFYSLFMLAFVLIVALTGRDFGPMRKAEQRARETGRLLSDHATPLSDQSAGDLLPAESTARRAFNAWVPIVIVIFVTLLGLYMSGRQSLLDEGLASPEFKDIIGASDPFSVLMWSSFAGTLVAGLLANIQRLLNVRETMDAFVAGVKSMMVAMIILTGAWAIGQICEDLKTAEYVIRVTQNLIRPGVMPLVTFLIAALISFSTGTSWGTLSILVPIVVPMAAHLSIQTQTPVILIGTIASVLSGSVFGDHCSPISDTTIMSSMSSGADHIDHVRTQIPYTVFVAAIALAFGHIPAGFGVHPAILIPLGLAVMLGLFLFITRRDKKTT